MNNLDQTVITAALLQQFVKQYADTAEPVEFRGLAEKFTTETIATCFFGLETNTIQNDNSEFLTMCKKVMGASLTVAVKRFVRDCMPGVFKRLSMHLNSIDVSALFFSFSYNFRVSVSYRFFQAAKRNWKFVILISQYIKM